MLTSNLSLIIGRVGRMPPGIVAAVGRATAVGYWRPRLEAAATKTILAQWALERSVAKRELYRQLTPLIVRTLTGELLDGPVSRFTLADPNAASGAPPAPGDLAGAMEANAAGRLESGARSKNYRLPPEQLAANAENLDAVKEGLLEWVASEKHKETEPGGRDAGLTDEQIAERLEFILGLGQTVKQRTEAMQEAAASLMPVVQDFLNRWSESEGAKGAPSPAVDGQVVGDWLAAVLASWVSLIELALPARLKYEVERELQKIGDSMI